MKEPFHDLNLSDFWEESDYAYQEYVDNPLTSEKVARIERIKTWCGAACKSDTSSWRKPPHKSGLN
jgi:hypothetical protein